MPLRLCLLQYPRQLINRPLQFSSHPSLPPPLSAPPPGSPSESPPIPDPPVPTTALSILALASALPADTGP